MNINTISTPQARINSLLKNVYLWMTAGLALTTMVAYAIGRNPQLVYRLARSGMMYAIIFAQLMLVVVLSLRLNRMSSRTAIACFALYSVATGASLSSIFVAYTGAVIGRAFLTATLMFGIMSLYAMTTRKDLSRMGNILFMALLGVIAASLVNLFLRSSALEFGISIVGVILFCGITAWDTQKIIRLNSSYGYGIDEDTFVKLSIICALQLYLDFINIFLYLLRIFNRDSR